MQKKINDLVEKLKEADTELDYSKVAWTEKHKIITLKEQSRVLIESLNALEGDDLKKVIETSEEFLEAIKPVISYINRDKGGK